MNAEIIANREKYIAKVKEAEIARDIKLCGEAEETWDNCASGNWEDNDEGYFDTEEKCQVFFARNKFWHDVGCEAHIKSKHGEDAYD